MHKNPESRVKSFQEGTANEMEQSPKLQNSPLREKASIKILQRPKLVRTTNQEGI
jgi:hypothetical protein